MRGERYAVVSCHVERPLDDLVWARFSEVQRRRPGGFAIAALMRPAAPKFGESEELWVERAREAQANGPLGHHVHWTAPDFARPTEPGAAEQVRREGARMRELGFEPTVFCGGGWYTDEFVAEACAGLGYADATPRPRRPAYLSETDRWAALSSPARIRLPAGSELTAIPTTHTLRELARALLGRSLPPVVHVYLHDYDLLDRRRFALVRLLSVLARRATVTDLDALVVKTSGGLPKVAWAEVARPTGL